MKLVLKDLTEVTITSMSDNYNARNVEDAEKRSISFIIMNPEDTVTIDYLKGILTDDNLSSVKLVDADNAEKTITSCKLTSINENVSDDSHYISIRASYC